MLSRRGVSSHREEHVAPRTGLPPPSDSGVSMKTRSVSMAVRGVAMNARGVSTTKRVC